MTPDAVSEQFERIMGCTASDLIRSLPAALPTARIEALTSADPADGSTRCVFADGTLQLAWKTLPPRRIAQLAIPQLRVQFLYEGLSAARRHEIQRRFDLATQRGGG